MGLRIEHAIGYAISLIEEVPYTRGTLHHHLCSELALSPEHVTEVCSALKAVGYMHSHYWEEYSQPLHCFYGKGVSQKKLDRFFEYIRVKDCIFNQSLGRVGEKYARHLFLEAGFLRVSQVGNLGKAFVNSVLADLRVFTRLPNEEVITLFVEVKNCREVFRPRWGEGKRPDIFHTLTEKAIRAKAQPVLIVAHISKRGKGECRKNGIAFLELGYQIVPIACKKTLRRIPENVLGKNEYMCVNPDRPFKHGVPEQSREHLRIIRDFSWIANANQIWRERCEGERVRSHNGFITVSLR